MPLRILVLPFSFGSRGFLSISPVIEPLASDTLILLPPDLPARKELVEPLSVAAGCGSAPELYRDLSTAIGAAIGIGESPLVLAGRCNSAIGTVAGLLRRYPRDQVGVIWLDGHSAARRPLAYSAPIVDALGLSALTSPASGRLANLVPDFSALPGGRSVLVGAHDGSTDAVDALTDTPIQFIPTDAIRVMGARRVLGLGLEKLRAIGVRHVYVHIDEDVLQGEASQDPPCDAASRLSVAEAVACLDLVADRFHMAAAGVITHSGRAAVQQVLRHVCASLAPHRAA